MPNQYSEEARGRGQTMPAPPAGYVPASRDALRARDAAARAGEGTVTLPNGTTLTGSAFRASSDPTVMAARQSMQSGGRSDPNLLFGAKRGRAMTPEEKKYRAAYSAFMNNPNDGVSGSEAAKAFAIWAAIALGGGALAGGAAGSGASAAGGAGGLSGSSLASSFGQGLIGEAAGTTAGSVVAPYASAAAPAAASGSKGFDWKRLAGNMGGGQQQPTMPAPTRDRYQPVELPPATGVGERGQPITYRRAWRAP